MTGTGRTGTDLFTKFHPVYIGQADVQDNQVHAALLKPFKALFALAVPGCGKTFGFKGIPDIFNNRRFVFNDEDMFPF